MVTGARRGIRDDSVVDPDLELHVILDNHARVAWTVTDRPWELEERLIRTHTLPLNLDQNRHSPFHQTLSTVRADQRARARALPIGA